MTMISSCEVDTALELITGKWKPSILLALINGGTLRFSELKRSLPNISQKILTAQLRDLEEHDIIIRTVYPEVPPRVDYQLSEYGKTLIPVLETMNAWGMKHAARMQQK
ncbi:transcriptional regulator [Exiguobacterium sp. SH4S7]|uniref:winged helix-turn-helix transcriptional regulator n=1 Tax=unclassified Exiguobacterium TaxID=2644629 RepID=UPI00103C94FA|nr:MULTISPECIES: helix-turn-helix domain-containing protein [unclassified Exiguobacterium]TCI34534.1 transcriptional regulator [Exiguobacterium sp. SH4S7]TCI67597.1 transcriptional regulator [Exiguobacterium sp. SH0S7]